MLEAEGCYSLYVQRALAAMRRAQDKKHTSDSFEEETVSQGTDGRFEACRGGGS